MMLRSWLFVPGDAPAKHAKAAAAGADALILDLEDSVAPARKAAARALVAEALLGARGATQIAAQIYVRINPLSSGLALTDLAAIMPAAPDGIVLPKPDSATDVARLSDYLDAFEAAFGQPAGRTRILPIATETPKSLFGLGGYGGARLAGMTWGAEDLPAAVGAASGRHADGTLTDLCRLARSLCLAGAAAAGVPAIDTVYPDFRDADGLRAYAAAGRREGFAGMMAIHPAQVPAINEVMTPTAAELDFAQRVVALFDAEPAAGVLSLDGKMLDTPHLNQARRLLGKTMTP
jgi:citrate lyase subunit beta/citryl-CoA lyase